MSGAVSNSVDLEFRRDGDRDAWLEKTSSFVEFHDGVFAHTRARCHKKDDNPCIIECWGFGSRSRRFVSHGYRSAAGVDM
jgi:hypothetical protein